MRKQWFGDARDYVKWSCIRRWAGDELAVVYAPMLRNDSHEGPNLAPEVVRYFDRLKDFSSLSALFPGGFVVDLAAYDINNADHYFERLLDLIAERQRSSQVLVFLDPDTGIEPKSSAPKNEHVRLKDIEVVCHQLRAGERLVVYQHAYRAKDWEQQRFDFLKPLADSVHARLEEPFREPGVARDVSFFTFTKLP